MAAGSFSFSGVATLQVQLQSRHLKESRGNALVDQGHNFQCSPDTGALRPGLASSWPLTSATLTARKSESHSHSARLDGGHATWAVRGGALALVRRCIVDPGGAILIKLARIQAVLFAAEVKKEAAAISRPLRQALFRRLRRKRSILTGKPYVSQEFSKIQNFEKKSESRPHSCQLSLQNCARDSQEVMVKKVVIDSYPGQASENVVKEIVRECVEGWHDHTINFHDNRTHHHNTKRGGNSEERDARVDFPEIAKCQKVQMTSLRRRHLMS